MSKERFKRACRIIKTVNRWVRAVIMHAAMFHPPPPCPRLTDDHPESIAPSPTSNVGDAEKIASSTSLGTMTFDKNIFRVQKEQPDANIPSDVKNILTMPFVSRTKEMIQRCVKCLQCMSAFAEYPRHMQEKLIEVGWFETVGPNRVIIRQTHNAENFYFLLSGSVIVTIMTKDPITGEGIHRTACILKRGSSFGELALLFQSRRTATVTSREAVQLLTVGRGAFFNIFSSDDVEMHHTDHIKFLRNMEFMQKWPIEKLVENPEMCLTHYFRRNQLISHDGGPFSTQWIYIVKAGSCDVIKSLEDPELYTDSASRKHLRKPPSYFSLANGIPVHHLIDCYNPNYLKEKLSDITTAPESTTFKGDQSENLDSSQVKIKLSPSLSILHTSSLKFNYPSVGDYDPRKLPRNSAGFLVLQQLNTRDTFGLSNLFFDEDIHDYKSYELLLVSRGVECVMINKEFFKKYTTPEIKKRLRFIVSLPPKPTKLPFLLKQQERWDRYKKQVISEVLDNAEKRRMIRSLKSWSG